MIRVMYRWTIAPGGEQEFIEHWKEGTRRIQANCEGAEGSFLIRDYERQEFFFGVARWHSRQAWETAQPVMAGLNLPGPLPETTEFFDEIADMPPAAHPHKP
ncbi:MAG: hypothetical protein JWM69_383 [Candidatus Binatus sp.]|nr:hypothetical protein [Candidatus Binatus sp.]